MEEITIDSYDNLVKIVEKITTTDSKKSDSQSFGYYFRGQANKDWKPEFDSYYVCL